MHQTKRESSSPLGPIMKAKSVNDLIDSLINTEDGSEESLEALDELIRRAALHDEVVAKNIILEGLLRAKTSRTVMVAPTSERAQ